ncbi:MAG: hypothetical protein LV481_01350, partial [Methylacidiphilales bacterium]|nr:hypothetical protein [Candidatus Methylacidiphilales bacterium]
RLWVLKRTFTLTAHKQEFLSFINEAGNPSQAGWKQTLFKNSDLRALVLAKNVVRHTVRVRGRSFRYAICFNGFAEMVPV